MDEFGRVSGLAIDKNDFRCWNLHGWNDGGPRVSGISGSDRRPVDGRWER